MQAYKAIHGDQAQGLLEILSRWGPLTTIVFSGGSVFEFKGAFPEGSVAEDFTILVIQVLGVFRGI